MVARNGFTLLELLITLLILSILTSISLPSFSNLVQRHKSDTVVRKLVSAIELARLSAVTHNRIVTLCRSRDGVKCSGKWRQGVIIFTDANGDRELNQDDELIHYISFPEIEGEIKWRAFQNRQYLQFTSQGFTRYQNGNFTYCPNNGNKKMARQLIINRSGRLRHAIDSNDDGIREDSRGKPIRC